MQIPLLLSKFHRIQKEKHNLHARAAQAHSDRQNRTNLQHPTSYCKDAPFARSTQTDYTKLANYIVIQMRFNVVFWNMFRGDVDEPW
jgi:hypothetical protein